MTTVMHTIGRRKTAVGRVFLAEGTGKILVNNKDYKAYFKIASLTKKLEYPFEVAGLVGSYDVKATVRGGGINGQAEALRLAIARVLCKVDSSFRPPLKAEGLLTRDARMVERKKYGQKKARKKYQFSKR